MKTLKRCTYAFAIFVILPLLCVCSLDEVTFYGSEYAIGLKIEKSNLRSEQKELSYKIEGKTANKREFEKYEMISLRLKKINNELDEIPKVKEYERIEKIQAYMSQVVIKKSELLYTDIQLDALLLMISSTIGLSLLIRIAMLEEKERKRCTMMELDRRMRIEDEKRIEETNAANRRLMTETEERILLESTRYGLREINRGLTLQLTDGKVPNNLY